MNISKPTVNRKQIIHILIRIYIIYMFVNHTFFYNGIDKNSISVNHLNEWS